MKLDLQLCDDDLWIYTSKDYSHWSAEKESDEIFHRINMGYFYIQWWDFPHKPNKVLKFMTKIFDAVFKNPIINRVIE